MNYYYKRTCKSYQVQLQITSVQLLGWREWMWMRCTAADNGVSKSKPEKTISKTVS